VGVVVVTEWSTGCRCDTPGKKWPKDRKEHLPQQRRLGDIFNFLHMCYERILRNHYIILSYLSFERCNLNTAKHNLLLHT
jgi:hypothetical protein